MEDFLHWVHEQKYYYSVYERRWFDQNDHRYAKPITYHELHQMYLTNNN